MLKQKENAPEKKLSVEVGHINSVHVNHVNQAKPRQGLRHNNTHTSVCVTSTGYLDIWIAIDFLFFTARFILQCKNGPGCKMSSVSFILPDF